MGTSFDCWSLYTSVLGSVESLVIVIHDSDERIVQGLQKIFKYLMKHVSNEKCLFNVLTVLLLKVNPFPR